MSNENSSFSLLSDTGRFRTQGVSGDLSGDYWIVVQRKKSTLYSFVLHPLLSWNNISSPLKLKHSTCRVRKTQNTCEIEKSASLRCCPWTAPCSRAQSPAWEKLPGQLASPRLLARVARIVNCKWEVRGYNSNFVCGFSSQTRTQSFQGIRLRSRIKMVIWIFTKTTNTSCCIGEFYM